MGRWILSSTHYGFLLWALCACQETPPNEEDTAVAEPLTLGEIRGTVTRSAEVQGDGVGSLIVLAFFNQIPDGAHQPQNAIVLGFQSFEEEDAAVEYSLRNLFPEPAPYHLFAVFDEDDSLLQGQDWLPTPGDLVTASLEDGPFEQVIIESGGVHIVDLDLAVIVE